MSRNSLILEKSDSAPPALLEAVPHSGEYLELTRHLFQSHSVVAVVDCGSGARAPEACRGIAAELAAAGHRVVIVNLDALLRTPQLPDVTACLPGRVPRVSLWPSTAGAPIDFFQSDVGQAVSPASCSSPTSPPANWLGSLRRNFDSVVLDCPSLEKAPAAAAIAERADSAVLVVDAGRTTRQQIQRDQQALKLRGVKLAGCILMRRRS